MTNRSLCFLVPKTINSVLSAFNLSLLESIQFLTSCRQLFSRSTAEVDEMNVELSVVSLKRKPNPFVFPNHTAKRSGIKGE